MGILNRAYFAIEFRTIKKIAKKDGELYGYSSNGSVKLPKICPHQGADLSFSNINGDYLYCHWHGCKFDLLKCRWVKRK